MVSNSGLGTLTFSPDETGWLGSWFPTLGTTTKMCQ